MISRRRIPIESLAVVACGLQAVYRFALVIKEEEDTIRKLMLQIDKQVEVFKSFYHINESVVQQQQEAYLSQMLIEPVFTCHEEIAV